MANVTVTVDIDKQNKKATFTPQEAVSTRHDTFRVQKGDTLTWELRDAQGKAAPPPAGFEAVITFVDLPKGSLPLLRGGNTVKTSGKVASGIVSDQAFKGRYHYRMDLVSPKEKIELTCFWGLPGEPAESAPMVGGENSAGPVNP